jgi:hypothetical protein
VSKLSGKAGLLFECLLRVMFCAHLDLDLNTPIYVTCTYLFSVFVLAIGRLYFTP